ncbi:MAG: hypothetical protein IJL91_13660 [Bacteroidales bacterium]|nr:hypothetical protein [Bacteroidales bacterium]
MEKKNRIILFWTLTVLGFLSHSLADALPAFWGESIVAQQGPAPVGMMAFMVCLTYLVPVVGILLLVYGGRKARIINAALACFMALFTLLHMSELIEGFNPVQLLIMPMMGVVAILMVVDSVRICKNK